MNLIKFDVTLQSGEVRHVMAESERDCIEWFESHMLKPTSVVVQTNPGRFDQYLEIPRAVAEVVVNRASMLQAEARSYEEFGRRVHRVLLKHGTSEPELVPILITILADFSGLDVIPSKRAHVSLDSERIVD